MADQEILRWRAQNDTVRTSYRRKWHYARPPLWIRTTVNGARIVVQIAAGYESVMWIKPGW